MTSPEYGNNDDTGRRSCGRALDPIDIDTLNDIRPIDRSTNELADVVFHDANDVVLLGSISKSNDLGLGPHESGTAEALTSKSLLEKLPVELWNNVFSFLPRSSQRVLLCVSHYIHGFVFPLVFKHVSIYFGLWDEDFSLEILEEKERRLHCAWEILSHIRDSSTFADVVMHLKVQVMERRSIVFERRLLCEALQKLPHLRSFEFQGFHDLPVDVASQLAASCPKLQRITTERLATASADELSRFKHLRSFRTIPPHGEHDFVTAELLSAESVSKILDNNLHCLREIALEGAIANKVSLIRVAENLTHLEIDKAGRFDGLELVLRHTTNLESLILIGLKDLYFLESFSGDSCQSLRFIKLRVIYESFRRTLDMTALSMFCHTRSSLRRFQFSLEDEGSIMYADYRADIDFHLNWFEILISIIKMLPSLVALGIPIPEMSKNSLEDSLAHLNSVLPTSMVAFHADINTTEELRPYHTLFDRLAEVPVLEFLSLYVVGDTPIEEAELVNILTSVRQICLLERTWDIIEFSEGRLLSGWEDDKWMFRDVSDFTSPEAFWLSTYYPGRPHGEEEDEFDGII